VRFLTPLECKPILASTGVTVSDTGMLNTNESVHSKQRRLAAGPTRDFEGRAKIATMIDDWFYRTAHDFRWDFHQPVSDDTTLYARYTFSYVSTLPEAQGKRVGFEGVAIMQLRDGLITEYREVANVGPAFVALGFAPEWVCKLVAREGEHLRRDPSFERHLV
jgi:hypothetical protein